MRVAFHRSDAVDVIKYAVAYAAREGEVAVLRLSVGKGAMHVQACTPGARLYSGHIPHKPPAQAGEVYVSAKLFAKAWASVSGVVKMSWENFLLTIKDDHGTQTIRTQRGTGAAWQSLVSWDVVKTWHDVKGERLATAARAVLAHRDVDQLGAALIGGRLLCVTGAMCALWRVTDEDLTLPLWEDEGGGDVPIRTLLSAEVLKHCAVVDAEEARLGYTDTTIALSYGPHQFRWVGMRNAMPDVSVLLDNAPDASVRVMRADLLRQAKRAVAFMEEAKPATFGACSDTLEVSFASTQGRVHGSIPLLEPHEGKNWGWNPSLLASVLAAFPSEEVAIGVGKDSLAYLCLPNQPEEGITFIAQMRLEYA